MGLVVGWVGLLGGGWWIQVGWMGMHLDRVPGGSTGTGHIQRGLSGEIRVGGTGEFRFSGCVY
ncbi:hypothetical protein Hamer_G019220 [Homarus americanus]|uniref:Uncharacterized protein n=1 Tax=Homarus americanus TaxID=6706 RepID=A0A8J5MNG6_HOMAM|nr:hypothetical protein Hamer_G019220 [Homarus americanus]